MEPIISVIIPIYNAMPCIAECISSVRNQTMKEIEILCIDDGSLDGSLDFVRKLQKEDARIRMIVNERNMGAGLSRNRGINEARGEYFIFLDSDDYVEPELLERVYERAKRDRLQLCIYPHNCFYDGSKGFFELNEAKPFFIEHHSEDVFSWQEVARYFYQSIFCVPWNRLYQTSFVRKSGIRFPDLKNSEDLFFGNALVTLADRMGYLGEQKALIHYRMNRPEQLSASVIRYPRCMLESFELLYNVLRRREDFVVVKRSFYSSAVYLLRFPLSQLEDPTEEYRYLSEEGLARIGMENLRRTDFVNPYDYEWYKAMMNGHELTGLDEYTVLWENSTERKEEIKAYFAGLMGKRTALWGLAKRGKQLMTLLQMVDYHFDFFIDRKKELQGKAIDTGIVQIFPDIAQNVDIIVITNENLREEVQKECRENGFAGKILDVHTFLKYDITIEESMFQMGKVRCLQEA